MSVIRCYGIHFASRKAAVVVPINISRNPRRLRIPWHRFQASWTTWHPSLFNVPHRYSVDVPRAGYQLCCAWLRRNFAKLWKALHTDTSILYWSSHRGLSRHKADKINCSSWIQKIWINHRGRAAGWWIRRVVNHCSRLHAADSCRFSLNRMTRLILVPGLNGIVIWKMRLRSPFTWTTVCCANHPKRHCWSTGAFWSDSIILLDSWLSLEVGQVDIGLSAPWRRRSTRTFWGASTFIGSILGGGFGLRTKVGEVNIGPSAINDWSLVHAGSLGAFLCGHGNL